MNLEFTAEQDDLRASVRAVLERECTPALVRSVVESGAAASDLWNRMVELGWPALTVPERDGGLGLGAVELTVVVEELGRAVAPVPYVATVALFTALVREAGDAAQRERFLGAVCEGTTGSLATGVSAREVGGRWVLDGTARFVLDAPRAASFAVVADVGGGARGAFVVPAASTAAVGVRPLDATRPIGHVALDHVEVAGGDVLGEPGSPAVEAAIERAVDEGTVAVAVETVGACQAIFDLALQHAKDRRQFGVPIGSFQAVKHKFADLLVSLERARACAYFAAATIAEGDPRRHVAASMAKAAAGDCQRHVAQEGIQVLGGIGFTWEHDVHLYVKRAKTGDALLGGAREHRARIAAALGL